MKSVIFFGLVMGIAILSGCSTAPTVSSADEWYCPPTRAALSCAGTGAENCGFDHYDAPPKERLALVNCVAKARAQGHPVAFGYIEHTPDSFMCTLGISRADNQYWSVEYSLDYSFPADDPRRGPAMFVGKCSSIKMTQTESKDPAPFTSAQCVADDEAFGYFRKHSLPPPP
jgi:hypothetical protein